MEDKTSSFPSMHAYAVMWVLRVSLPLWDGGEFFFRCSDGKYPG